MSSQYTGQLPNEPTKVTQQNSYHYLFDEVTVQIPHQYESLNIAVFFN